MSQRNRTSIWARTFQRQIVAMTRLAAAAGKHARAKVPQRVVARPGVDNAVAFDPCFSIYDVQSRLCGVEFRQAKLNADFSFPFDDLLALVDENTALVFVTNPDNPSGHACPAADLVALEAHLVVTGSRIIAEEATCRDVHPVHALLQRVPHWALTAGASVVSNQFRNHRLAPR